MGGDAAYGSPGGMQWHLEKITFPRIPLRCIRATEANAAGRVWQFVTLIACLFLTGAALAEPARVQARIGLSGVQIEASVPVQADRATLWATLTDYNRLAEFVPNLVVSRVVSAPGQPKRVEQRGNAGMLSFLLPDHVVLAMEELPPGLIRFRAVSGSVLAMSGEWRVEGETRPVRLSYRARIMPRVPPPPLLSEGFIEDEVRQRFEAVAQEAERRAGNRR